MIIIGGMGRKKENRAGGEKREGRGEGEKMIEGERVKESAKGEGNEKQNAAMERNREKCQGLLPRPLSNDNHFYVTAIIRPFLLQQT